jgi:hypothetical protein
MGKKEITLTAPPDIKTKLFARDIFARDIFLPNVGTFRKSGSDKNFKR